MQLPFIFKRKNKKGFIGVDIQLHGIAVAHILPAEQDSRKAVLKQCAFQTFDPDDPEDILRTFKQLLSSFPVKQFACNASISETAYELLLIDAPKVESSELKQAVRWRIKEQLPYHIDDAVIDVFEIPGQPSNRQQLMYVVSSQQLDIDSRVLLVKQAGLNLHSIDIFELAQRNIATILPEDKEGIVMLRINRTGGLLTITRNGSLYLTRKIDFNIHRLRLALEQSEVQLNDQASISADDIELDIDETEEQRDSAGVSAGDGVGNASGASTEENTGDSLDEEETGLSAQSKLIVDELVLEIQRSLDYYISHFNQRAVSKIVFAPMDLDVTELIAYINDMLGVKAAVLDFNDYLNLKKPLDNTTQSHCFNAVGLALRQEAD